MKNFNIMLHSINDVKTFVNSVNKYDFDVDLTSGRYVVDAKSIMGIFSLDLSKPIKVEVYAEEVGAFMDEMKRMTSDMLYEGFAAEGLCKEQADAAMKEAYGMSMEEYLTAYIDSVDMDEIFAAFKSEQV